jgi:hypothetical protein
MPRDFLHNHRQFADLIRIVAEEQGIAPALIEKDYWIMQSLYGLQQLGLTFELKGGTSLSKGYGLISRFSEDIDIRIEPPTVPQVMTGRNHDKAAHVQSRKDFYDRLAQTIVIDGITSVERDAAFDDPRQYRSAGIRLTYASTNGSVEGLKDGVLLEVGFDDVAPNEARDISSWAYDFAASQVRRRGSLPSTFWPGTSMAGWKLILRSMARTSVSSSSLPTRPQNALSALAPLGSRLARRLSWSSLPQVWL